MILSPWERNPTMPRHATQTRCPGLAPHHTSEKDQSRFPTGLRCGISVSARPTGSPSLEHVRDDMVWRVSPLSLAQRAPATSTANPLHNGRPHFETIY